MIHVRDPQSPWIVIVEADDDAKLLVVVTVYEVSQSPSARFKSPTGRAWRLQCTCTSRIQPGRRA